MPESTKKASLDRKRRDRASVPDSREARTSVPSSFARACPMAHMRVPWIALALAAVLASCHTAYRPFEIAERCGCAVNQYCRVKPASSPASGEEASTSVDCLPIPTSCSDPPTCACLGRSDDACREELGRFWVFERRGVADCSDCTGEEYCWTIAPTAGAPTHHACGLLPPQCEDDASCACFERARHLVNRVACQVRDGRIEASPVETR
jgi:hypothetical protein